MSDGNKNRKFNKFRNRSRPGKDFKSNRFANVHRLKAPQLIETEVGITEYMSSYEGFNGVIKARFSDFQVNEIDINGVEAKLTDRSVPKENVEESKDVERPDYIPEEIWENIEKLIAGDRTEPVEFDVTSVSKERRGEIHNSVKTKFGRSVVASTITKDDKKFVLFTKYDKNVPRDRRLVWPKDTGEYVHFLVYKESVDTITACFKISDSLGIRPTNFTYAGVKDRRAKSTQWFCVRKVLPSRLFMKTNNFHNIKIGNVIFKDKPLKLGQLKGNRFRIALRNVTAEDGLINNAMESLKNNGFINYYGLQRFGNDKVVPTYLIGIKLLQGNWKEACDLILKIKESDDPHSDILAAKKLFSETSNASKAAAAFNRNKNRCVESKLLEGLAKNGLNDYVNSLENIPRNMRLLYIHAFQSLMWNKIVSRRINKFGLKPIEGDLVFVSEDEKENEVVDDEEVSEVKDAEGDDSEQYKPKEVKILTKDDLGKYTISDIVLPLPGYAIVYPENEVKEWYSEALEQHGLSLEMHKQRVKSYNLSGSYRKVCGTVENCHWYTLLYNDPNYNLIRSDLEELMGEEEPKSVPDGQFKALVIDFILKPSSYATMALREILKIDTSSNAHSKLNEYHKPEEVKMKETIVEKSSESNFAECSSLLNDADKFAAFKNCVFNTSAAVKRKIESEGDETEGKRLKKDETEANGDAVESS